MNASELLEKSKEYALEMLSNLPEEYHYHNADHTREVVVAAKEIGHRSGLSDEEINIVLIAAWFHDLGYRFGLENHEQESIKLMRTKLNEWEAEASLIDQVARIIESTKMPQSPKDELSKIICDADLFHLSSEAYEEKSKALLSELNNVCDKEIDQTNWQKMNAEFLNKHSYFTNYGKTVLEPLKKKNLKKVNKVKGKDAKYIKSLEDEVIKLKTKLEQSKIQKPDRGIETMFRITSKNHLTLSGMADNKANIMISINSIILSVLISILFRKFEEYPNLIIPAIILVIVCLTTIVFAVLATRPNVSSGKFTKEDIIDKKTNLLFFGNFHSMELDNYMWGMREMMKDADFLYGSMIKDIYFLGRVLGKKYRMLRKSYTIFMYGFIISIIAFAIAMILYPHGT